MANSKAAPTFSVAVKRDFVARHFLFGGDWGSENQLHSHHYQVEVCLEGSELDRHGYLVDIVDIENCLNGLVDHYRDRDLNELPEFTGFNPSIERLSSFFLDAFWKHLSSSNVEAITIKLWENDIAWASCRREKA